MLGGLVGGICKAIGLEEIAPIASMITNAATGNYAAAATDLIEVVGQLTGSEFLQNISKMNPLGGFGAGGGGFDVSKLIESFTSGDKGGIAQSFLGLIGGAAGIDQGTQSKIMGLFDTVQGAVNDKQLLDTGLAAVRGGRI